MSNHTVYPRGAKDLIYLDILSRRLAGGEATPPVPCAARELPLFKSERNSLLEKSPNSMIFKTCGKEYRGATAIEIINAIREDAFDNDHQEASLPEFLLWSLAKHGNRIPQRELDVSDRLSDEMLALNYLYLRVEYGLGELLESRD